MALRHSARLALAFVAASGLYLGASAVAAVRQEESSAAWKQYAADLVYRFLPEETMIEQAGADAIELNIYDIPADLSVPGSAIEDHLVRASRI